MVERAGHSPDVKQPAEVMEAVRDYISVGARKACPVSATAAQTPAEGSTVPPSKSKAQRLETGSSGPVSVNGHDAMVKSLLAVS